MQRIVNNIVRSRREREIEFVSVKTRMLRLESFGDVT